jgi:hypothetical protein
LWARWSCRTRTWPGNHTPLLHCSPWHISWVNFMKLFWPYFMYIQANFAINQIYLNSRNIFKMNFLAKNSSLI